MVDELNTGGFQPRISIVLNPFATPVV